MFIRGITFLAVGAMFLAGCAGHPSNIASPKGAPDRLETSVNELLTRYAQCLDKAHAPCADLFTDDGTLNLAKGRAAIATQLDKESAITAPGTHRVSNIKLNREAPDRVAVISDINFLRNDETGKWAECATYRYFDEIVTVNGALRFARRDTAPIHYRKNLGYEASPTCETWDAVGQPGSFEVAAANLIGRYGETVDMREMKSLANLFTEDASLTGLNEKNETIRIHGRGQIEAYMTDHAGFATPGMHTVRYFTLEKTGPNSGSAITYMTFFRRDEKAVWQIRLAYKYFDTFRRVNGVWLISRRDNTPPSAEEAAAEAIKAGDTTSASDPASGVDDFESGARALIAGYSWAVNTHDIPACKALFAENGSIESAYGLQTGRGEITCGLRPSVSDLVGAHAVTDIVLKREGPDRGSGITDAVFFRRDEAGGWIASSHPRYFDQFVRVNGKWLIDRRENTNVGR